MPDLQSIPPGRETREQQAERVEDGQPQEPRLGPVCLLRDTPAESIVSHRASARHGAPGASEPDSGH